MRMAHAGRPLAAAVLAVVLHLPFVVRYDLHFQPDFAISLLMAQAITEGERPVFFWGQDYLGTYGCYLTALLFRAVGPSIVAAGLVSVAIFAIGVAGATLLAERVFGARAAWWTGLAAAVSSPYANHYTTQAYSSYETAPLLTVLLVAAATWAGRGPHAPYGLLTATRWAAGGFLVGFGLWTTRLIAPALLAVCVAAVRCVRWRALPVRQVAVALALAGVGCVVGAGPELLHRAGLGAPSAEVSGEERAFVRLAPPSAIPRNLLQGLRAVPAYFNGDPLARRPEGMTFLLALWEGEVPYGGAQETPLAHALDVGVRVVFVWLLFATLRTLAQAWRARDLPCLALCLVPFVHLALIALSAQTNGDYYAARRYWFGSLLVFAMLLGNAVATAAAHPKAVCRLGGRIAAVLLVAWMMVGQVRMLGLPDELADYRALVRDLHARGFHSVIMPGVGWVVAGLSLGDIDVVDGPCTRRPQACAAVLGDTHAVLVLHDQERFPGDFTLFGRSYGATDESPHEAGRLRWLAYRLRDRGRSPHGRRESPEERGTVSSP
jgi:hypothetical protein